MKRLHVLDRVVAKPYPLNVILASARKLLSRVIGELSIVHLCELSDESNTMEVATDGCHGCQQ
ncbi:MAG: hypothetical protein ABGZ23_00700, partial [Fuerstiella sp.]